jgi:hypothetical protein
MGPSPVLPSDLIHAGWEAGARNLRSIQWPVEPSRTALAVERHRWAWRPDDVRVILIAESHVYTSANDLALTVRRDRLPQTARLTPSEFVRLIYCLGYGEPELVAGQPKGPNVGTRQFWDIFARCAGTQPQPSGGRSFSWEERVRWKVKTLAALRDRGVWLLDASLHAIYTPGGQRVPYKLQCALHRQWWEGYGSWLVGQSPNARVHIIGKVVADVLQSLSVPFNGWIYQPQAQRSATIDMAHGWPELLQDIG